MSYSSIEWSKFHAAVWRSNTQSLRAIATTDPITLAQLVGIDEQKQAICHNTQRFLKQLSANNVLLWGSRGTGKSSLIKALLNEYHDQGLRIVEVYKNDLQHLPDILDQLRDQEYRFIIYCDDFSFEANDDSYVGLKTLLEGSIERPPENVLLYATSNRRHLIPESMADNLASGLVEGELHYADAIEEKISLSDRFGLWLSFYPPNQETYLAMVDSYFPDYQGDREALHHAAKQFAMLRASRSGRTAKQFFNQYPQE